MEMSAALRFEAIAAECEERLPCHVHSDGYKVLFLQGCFTQFAMVP